MASNTVKRIFGPVALTTTLTTNIYNNTSALIYDIIRHIHICNKSSSGVAVSLWLGASGANAAGTELFNLFNIPANSTYDYYCTLKLLSTDFLVGGANGATALSIYAEGEQGVV